MGVPPVLIPFNRMFHYKPTSYWGTPMTMETRVYGHLLHPTAGGRPALASRSYKGTCPSGALGAGGVIELQCLGFMGGISTVNGDYKPGAPPCEHMCSTPQDHPFLLAA